jgi:ketosteroid isomerase-like protein
MSPRTWLIVGGSLWFATSCSTAARGGGDVRALLETDREWAKLVSVSRNADSIATYWTDDARVISPGQPVVSGKRAIREMVAGMMKIPGFRIGWTPDSAVVARSGDLGYTYGANEVTAPDSAGKLVTTRGRYLTVWRKETDGRWRCVEDIASPSPTAGAP